MRTLRGQIMRSILLGLAGACLLTATAAAQSAVEITRAVYVEREGTDRSGRKQRTVEPAEKLRKGDVVVLMLEWSAPDGSESFVVASRIPRDLAFRRSGGRAPQVSTDGGRSWGELGQLRIGPRLATPEDVTHVRWHVSGVDAAHGRGTLAYSAIVR